MQRGSGAAQRIALLLALALLGCSDLPGDAPTAPGERRVAPDFEHPDLGGQTVRLSDLRGRTVVIDFWATWCPPCAFQPRELNDFWRRHRDSGQVMVLGVEVGGASVAEIRDWAAENRAEAEYPILTGADEDLARRFGALGFPALAVVAPDGKVSSLHVGLTSAEEIEALVTEAARASPPEPEPPATPAPETAAAG